MAPDTISIDRPVTPQAPVADGKPMIDRKMSRGNWAILLLLALIWGGAFFFIHIAVRSVPTFTYVSLRLGLAAGAMWLWVAIRREPVGLPRRAWGSIAVLALLNTAIPFALFGWAQTHIVSGLASILNATTPLWGVIVAHWFTTDERLTPGKLAGVLIGVAGVAVMIGPGLSGASSDVLAELACVAAALFYAFAGVWARRFKRMGISPIAVTTGQLTAGALLCLPVALIVERPWTLPFPPLEAVASIVALAVVCTAFGYVLYFRLIDSAGATNALLVTLLVPPFAILLGALFLGETLDPRDIAGMALIAVGLAAIDGRVIARFRGAAA